MSIRVATALSTGLVLAVGSASLASAATGAATATVNIRSGPGTSHAVVGGLVRGQRITTTSSPASGWVAVNFAGSRAYIASRYVDSTGALPAKPTRISTRGTKVVTERLNVRSGPSAQRAVVGRLAQGRRITLTGRLSRGFAQIRYEGRSRWVSVAYLASTPARPTSTNAGTRPATPAPTSSKGKAALAFAKRQLGKPYRFGAAGPSSYDCSGLTLAAWRAAGTSLPRTSQEQYRQGRKTAKSQLRGRELVFFYSLSASYVGL